MSPNFVFGTLSLDHVLDEVVFSQSIQTSMGPISRFFRYHPLNVCQLGISEMLSMLNLLDPMHDLHALQKFCKLMVV